VIDNGGGFGGGAGSGSTPDSTGIAAGSTVNMPNISEPMHKKKHPHSRAESRYGKKAHGKKA